MHKTTRQLWKRLRRVRKSTLFLVLFLIGLILFDPVKQWLDVTIMKYELEKAIVAYAEEYCGTKVKVKKINADIISSPFPYNKRWSAVTEPEDLSFNGLFFNDFIVFTGIRSCSDSTSFLLDRKLDRFVVDKEVLPPPKSGLNQRALFAYFWACVAATVIYMVLWSLEDKKKKRN